MKWGVVAMTSAAMVGSRRRWALWSGPVINCVKGAALGPKASAKVIEWVEAAPCDGVARTSVRAVVMGWLEELLVQSCTAMVCESSHPLISRTMPLGAAVRKEGSSRHGACVCHSCPIRMLVGERESGRSGRGAAGPAAWRRCLIAGSHREVWRLKASDTVQML